MQDNNNKKNRKDEIMDDVNWEKIAKDILKQEEVLKACNYPAPTPVLVTWKDGIYIGSIQDVAPGFSDEIVVLSKSTYKLPSDLVNAIRRSDKERLELVAEDNLGLDGRQHVLRRLGNRLVYMTSEQTEHMVKNLPDIYEI
jgi:Ribonuclease G/E